MAFDSVEPSDDRRHEVQGLRAIAVLSVVAFHAGLPVPGGFVGVDIFFVISGFVITNLLTTSHELHPTLRSQLTHFYSRRIKRILPALGTMVLAVTVVSFVLESPWGEQARTSKSAFASLAVFANVYYAMQDNGYFALGSKTNPLLHTWSLSLEEQFYLVYPLLIVLVLKSRWSRILSKILVVLVAISFAASVAHSYRLWPVQHWDLAQQFSFYSLWTRSWEFLVGGVLALSPSIASRENRQWLGQACAMVGTVVVLASIFLIQESSTFPGVTALAPVLGTGLLIAGCSWHPQGLICRLLSTVPMTWIGDRSYSLYLWHWPVIVFLNRQYPDLRFFSAIAISLSLLLAVLSYSFVEESWRHRPRISRRSAAFFAGVFIILPTAVSVRLYFNDLERRQNPAESVAGTLDTKELASCWPENEIEGTRFDLAICLNQASTAQPYILLVGDSHAGSLIYSLDDVAVGLDAIPNVASKPSCPLAPDELAVFLYNFSDQNLMTRDDCAELLSEIEIWTSVNSPKYTIVAINAPFYVGSPGLTKSFELRQSCFLYEDKSCDRSPNPRDRVLQYRPMLEKSLRFLSAASDHVILIAPIPIQYRDQIDLPEGYFGRGTPRRAVDAVRQPIMSLYDSLRDEFPNLIVWDPISILCSEDFCPSGTEVGDLYSDNTHLSIYGASQLTNPLIELLQSLK